MSEHNLPDIKYNQLIAVLERLGFNINYKGGNGSHVKATWPPTGKFTTIQRRLDPYVIKRLIRQIEILTDGQVTQENIIRGL